MNNEFLNIIFLSTLIELKLFMVPYGMLEI